MLLNNSCLFSRRETRRPHYRLRLVLEGVRSLLLKTQRAALGYGSHCAYGPFKLTPKLELLTELKPV